MTTIASSVSPVEATRYPDPLVRSCIGEALSDIEREERVRILYACEGGSRAWGFASPQSDYDIHFVYVRPPSAYLALDVPRDTLERALTVSYRGNVGEGEEAAPPPPSSPASSSSPPSLLLDTAGWDLIKALRLLRKSNPLLIEWLFSPVIYAENPPFCTSVRYAAQQYYAPSVLVSAYEHMAAGNYRQYIRGKAQPLLKKYLYVLRPLVQVLYLKQHAGALPPVDFSLALSEVEIPLRVKEEITELMLCKIDGEDLAVPGLANLILNAWIEGQLLVPNEEEYDPACREQFSIVLQGILTDTLRYAWEHD